MELTGARAVLAGHKRRQRAGSSSAPFGGT
jgi:hypothetical protein